jgi:O-antigen/teichoic acid export membrane protein
MHASIAMVRRSPVVHGHDNSRRYRRTVPRPRALLTRVSLPDGAYAIGVGCVISGVAAYAFLAVTARVLGPVRFTPLSQLWALALLLSPGTFLAVEQEVTRAVAARDTVGEGYGAVVRAAGGVGAVVCGLWLAAVAVSAPFLLGRLFEHQWLLLIGLAASLPSYFALHLTWGTLAGSRRFGRYATLTAGEGLLRLALCLALVVAGVRSAGPYGLVVGITPLLLVATAGRLRAGPRGPHHPWRSAGRKVGELLGGSLFNQVLLMVPPIFVALLATPAERTKAGTFVVAMVLVRVPLFLFNAVLASMLALLAREAVDSSPARFRRTRRRLLLLVVAFGAISTVLAAGIGSELLRLFFGEGFTLGRADLAILGAACGAYMVALILGQALVAQAQHFRTTVAWGCGLATFGLALFVHGSVVPRVESAFLAGCLVAALVMWLETAIVDRHPLPVVIPPSMPPEPLAVGLGSTSAS